MAYAICRRIPSAVSSPYHLTYHVCVISCRVYAVWCIMSYLSCVVGHVISVISWDIICAMSCHIRHLSTQQVSSKWRCDRGVLVFAYTCLPACFIASLYKLACLVAPYAHASCIHASCIHASNLRTHFYIFTHMGAYRCRYR